MPANGDVGERTHEEYLYEYATNQAQRNFCGTLFENMNEDSTVELHVRLLVSLQPRPEKEPHRELASLMR